MRFRPSPRTVLAYGAFLSPLWVNRPFDLYPASTVMRGRGRPRDAPTRGALTAGWIMEPARSASAAGPCLVARKRHQRRPPDVKVAALGRRGEERHWSFRGRTGAIHRGPRDHEHGAIRGAALRALNEWASIGGRNLSACSPS